ncbi:unnamed protein product [Arabidopsis lyrata]|uniref:Predicted protein n=1 Tax=Arabidopsis lyrata subsp. lyrata TaxID=81972 RepID=D7LBX0_ARALL|nr:uncharacterized protein LOC9314630 [Arabidopsis lyrata subsp. lyrata]EFH54822.1 predicted protein [Arabidopsis lyrata subsp. lyrata]CAH8263010.1 unnamed protein product [Arabidopsis lyrata]|eukprot:XP_002878563.1 uncharacterized protein LOC9314630 [Arabidopsis lyrata subsp. lyrata]
MASQTKQTVVDTQKIETENPPKPEVPLSSCRKRVKDDNATFFENLKDHMDEFIHASMDEHKTCFKNTMNKMFGTFSKSDAVAEKQFEAKEVVEIHSPLQAAVTK